MSALKRPHPRPYPRPARGLGAVAVVVVLVAMAAMAAAVLRLSVQGATTQQQDLQGIRAAAAARSGLDWGLYQALKGSWTACSGASQTLDFTADAGVKVTVSCSMSSYNEGESGPGTPAVVRVYSVEALACMTAGASCPDATAAVRQGYVERRVQASVVN